MRKLIKKLNYWIYDWGDVELPFESVFKETERGEYELRQRTRFGDIVYEKGQKIDPKYELNGVSLNTFKNDYLGVNYNLRRDELILICASLWRRKRKIW